MITTDYKFPYWGPFLFESKVDNEFVNLLLEKGNESREKNLDERSRLAGVIENQFYYENYREWFAPKFSSYLSNYMEALKESYCFVSEEMLDWELTNLWINYQKALEYNPPHNHRGDLSFVIYLQVPDELKKEYETMRRVRQNTGPGTIVFDYGVELPFSINNFFKFPNVGDLFIFPTWLNHYVHAFKSDVERISVSGNIFFNKLNLKNHGRMI